MKLIRITLKQNPLVWFDHPLGPGMTLNQIVGQVRTSGYFMVETVYVPHDSIAHICVMELQDGAETPMDFTKARMQ